jgi:hypothetical protein
MSCARRPSLSGRRNVWMSPNEIVGVHVTRCGEAGRPAGRSLTLPAGLFSGQELVAVTIDEFVQRGLHGPGQVGRNNSLTIAGDPFFHSVHYELLFGNPHELALSSQPIELDCADHHPEGTTGLIRLLGKRCRIIIPHKLDSQQNHRMDSPAPSRGSARFQARFQTRFCPEGGFRTQPRVSTLGFNLGNP